jgi:hypothetical protein
MKAPTVPKAFSSRGKGLIWAKNEEMRVVLLESGGKLQVESKRINRTRICTDLQELKKRICGNSTE